MTSFVLELAMNLFGPERLAGGIFADICAGSGLVGFEAVSRGAELAFMVEADSRQARQLAATAADWGIREAVTVLRTDARRCFGTIAGKLPEGRRLSMVFLDPPFIPGMARDLLEALSVAARRGNLLEPGALLILRTPDRLDQDPAGPGAEGLALIEARPAGSAKLWLYRPAE